MLFVHRYRVDLMNYLYVSVKGLEWWMVVYPVPYWYEMCMLMNLTQSLSLWMTLILIVYMQLFLVIVFTGLICFSGCVV